MRSLPVFLGGILFGFGLALSGMARPEVVLSFLHLQDLGLLLVMGAAAGIAAAAFRLVPRLLERPFHGSYGRHRAWMRPRTIAGAAVFGLGWGLSGLCPGSAVASLGLGNLPNLLGVGGMFLGAYLQGRLLAEPAVTGVVPEAGPES